MRWAATIAEESRLELAVDSAAGEVLEQLDHRQPDLALVFVAPPYSERSEQVVDLLGQWFGDAVVLGCSAGGVIGGGRECERSSALALTGACLPDVTLTPFHLQNASLPDPDAPVTAWEALLGIPMNRRPHFLLLGDPRSFNPEPLLTGLDLTYPESCKLGGLASGADHNRAHCLYLNGAIHRSGLVGVALHGNLEVDAVVAQGCRPIGQPLFATAVEHNRILSLDGRSPLEIMQTLYQELDAGDQALFAHSLFLGLAMREGGAHYRQGDFLIRNLIGIDPDSGALALGALPQPNGVVQFHLRDAVTAAEELDALLARAATGPSPDGALLFSCLGRGEQLYGEPDHDSHMFARHFGPLPLGGCFCNGEIGPVQGTTFLHGYTSVFALFRAPPRSRNTA